LWNAARFVLMNTSSSAGAAETDDAASSTSFAHAQLLPISEGNKTPAEHWILSRLADTLAEVEAQFVTYRFDLVAQALYEFVWNDYCDWFLELTKPALNGDDAAAAASTRATLVRVLEAILRALHPITPFITEEIWQNVAPMLGLEGKSITDRPYPTASEFGDARDTVAIADVEWLKSVLSNVRRIRSEMNISPGKQIPLLFAKGNEADRVRTEKFAAQIAFLARTEWQRWLADAEEEPASASAIVGDLRILIPLAGLIDLSAEKARLGKEIKRIEGEIGKCNGKLASETFVANAPAAVVEQERQRLTDFTNTLQALKDQAARL
jgi:valyl-tRNA synthetase